MARDYKHRATSRKRRKAVSPWLGVTVGLLVGLFVAFLVYIKMLAPKSPGEISATTTVAPQATPEETRQGNDMQTPQPPKPSIKTSKTARPFSNTKRGCPARKPRGKPGVWSASATHAT
jgi:hypothetical protein